VQKLLQIFIVQNYNKETTIKKLVDSKNYKMVIDSINNFLPEKVENYKVVRYSEVALNVKNARNIPEMVIDNKKYILTSGTQSLFADLYGGNLKGSTNLVVDILNANGVGGYARKTGENLKNKLSLFVDKSTGFMASLKGYPSKKSSIRLQGLIKAFLKG